MISLSHLKDLLHYDAETGIFRWRVQRPHCSQQVGSVAGCKSGNGYWIIRIDNFGYKAHRLAWFYVYGEWPTGEIDHRDTDKSNNRILNLRPASRGQNVANVGLKANNKTGLKGVRYVTEGSRKRRWNAQITENGRTRNLGWFESPEDASVAYATAAAAAFGEFARLG